MELRGHEAIKRHVQCSVKGVGIPDIPALEAKRKDIDLTRGTKDRKEYEPSNLVKGRSDPGTKKEKEVSG